ncbi:MAG: rhodanese-like domain-containing protein [Lentisphaeraceae bacterium]|nr:rhodanese-like domain-containing protein [Lentisphaeraceae bacterium]
MKNHAPGFLNIVNDAKSRIKETNVDAVKQRLDKGDSSFELIDVREDGEWNKGYIPSSIHIGKGVMERDVEKLIPDHSKELILYCGGGFRSALAADNLQKMGYTNVWSMDGGFRGWNEAGYDLSYPEND